MKFGKAARLRRRREYLAVQERGARVYSGDVIVLALDQGGPGPRIGITVSSKVANAVVRNRVRRWAREAFRSVSGALPPLDFVVIARAAAVKTGRAGMVRALEAAGAKAREKGARP